MPPEKLPQPGDLFRLDGFTYELGEVETRFQPDGTPVYVRAFNRPAAPTPELAQRWQQNNSYKKAGKCLGDEIQWFAHADWVEALAVQAARTVRTQAPAIRPAMKLWTDAVQAELLAAYAGTEGCFALPDRHLLKLPIDLDDRVIWPGDAEEAVALAHSTLHSEG